MNRIRIRLTSLETATLARELAARLVEVEVVIRVDPGSPAGKKALRGVPVVGAVTGTSPDTDPLMHLLDRCCDCGRAKHPDERVCDTCHDARTGRIAS